MRLPIHAMFRKSAVNHVTLIFTKYTAEHVFHVCELCRGLLVVFTKPGITTTTTAHD